MTASQSPTPTKIPFGNKRGRLMLASGILSLVLIPGDFLLSVIFVRLFPSFPYDRFQGFFQTLHVIVSLGAPLLAISVWVWAHKTLQVIHKGTGFSDNRVIILSKTIGVVGTILNPCLVLILTISLFSGVTIPSNKDEMVNDLNNIAGDCYMYRIRPKSMGGGQGTFIGYKIPDRRSSNENGTYELVKTTEDEITVIGRSLVNPANTIQVTVTSEGRLSGWIYEGGFQQ